MNRKTITQKITALCLATVICVTSCPAIGFAKEPTIDTVAYELTLGKNQLRFDNYDGDENTLMGSFTVPETGRYTFNVTNNGSDTLKCHILNEDLADISEGDNINPTEYSSFENWSLKKDQKIYFYIESFLYRNQELLAVKVDIKKLADSKNVPKLNKTAISLKVKSKTTLKLINNKEEITWVSSNKKIATVSSKGVVTAKSKGKAYIYAIVDSKAYKCKVVVYK